MRLMPHGRAHDLFFLCNELCGVNHLRRSRTFNRDDFVFFFFHSKSIHSLVRIPKQFTLCSLFVPICPYKMDHQHTFLSVFLLMFFFNLLFHFCIWFRIRDTESGVFACRFALAGYVVDVAVAFGPNVKCVLCVCARARAHTRGVCALHFCICVIFTRHAHRTQTTQFIQTTREAELKRTERKREKEK